MNWNSVKENIVSWIRQYIAESKSGGVVLGLSGGLDSAVTAALSVEALGADSVDMIALPYRVSDPSSLDDARKISEHLGGKLEVFNISAPVDDMIKLMGGIDELQLGNITARMRMIVLYNLSAKRCRLVAGTGNRTESYLGYSTLWGDMACAFTPIGGLFKTQERKLARELGLPEWIITKTPTADLWHGQTDEGELGITYEIADKILFAHIEKSVDRAELLQMGFSSDEIDLVLDRIIKYNYKRRMPVFPSIKRLPL
ncbi:NAD+ synthase [bacterium]|nr:NAD+ synthase [bacterium]